MKNLSSQIEGVWKEKLIPTQSQLLVLQNGTQEEKEAVILAITVNPSNSDLALAIQTYNQNKPTDENYYLISCDLTIDDNIRGIINCRVNGEHKQIRF